MSSSRILLLGLTLVEQISQLSLWLDSEPILPVYVESAQIKDLQDPTVSNVLGSEGKLIEE